MKWSAGCAGLILAVALASGSAYAIVSATFFFALGLWAIWPAHR